MKIFNLLVFTACLMSISCGLSQIPSYVPSNGLVGWWPFTGNANDLSGNGNNGTVNGATLTSDRFGNTSQAYNFDGNDNIDIGTLFLGSVNQSFTVSAWFYTNNLPSGYGYLISDYSSNSGGDNIFAFHLGQSFNSGLLYFDKQNMPSYFFQGQTNSALNQWVNVTVVSNAVSGIIELYLNNTLVPQMLVNSTNVNNQVTIPYYNSTYDYSSNQYFRFGCDKYNGILQEFFKGKLDDIGIWNRALTQQEITNLYNANNGPQASISTPNNSLCAGQSTTLTATVANPGTSCNTAGLPPSLVNGLVGYWPFCGNANDASGNGNNGTVSGATLTNDRFGTANSAYSFNGSSRIDVGTLNNQIGNPNSSWSVNCWFKSAGSQIGDMVLVSDYSSPSGGDQIVSTWLALWSYTFNNKVGSTIRNFPNGWDALSTNSYNDNQWHSLMSVAENGILKIYVDGILITTVTYPANTNFQGSPFFRFGTILFNGQYDSYFQGQLDDIGIWNRALTAQEVSLLYTAGRRN